MLGGALLKGGMGEVAAVKANVTNVILYKLNISTYQSMMLMTYSLVLKHPRATGDVSFFVAQRENQSRTPVGGLGGP